MKIMASGPITLWQIDVETMETVTDFIFLNSKIIADGYCSHRIKRCLLLGRKAMANLLLLSLQLCLTLCDSIEGSPPGSAVPGILQARTLEGVAISFSNAWKWKVRVKSLSHFRLLATHGPQPTRLLHPWDFQARILECIATAFSVDSLLKSNELTLPTKSV